MNTRLTSNGLAFVLLLGALGACHAPPRPCPNLRPSASATTTPEPVAPVQPTPSSASANPTTVEPPKPELKLPAKPVASTETKPAQDTQPASAPPQVQEPKPKPPAKPPEPTPAEKPPERPLSDSSAGKPAPSPLTGGLSEADFKALHMLPLNETPPRKGEMIQLAPNVNAYLALPVGVEPPLAGVVVIHEWWGLNGHIMHFADRLSADGYAALAVDLYGGVVATDAEAAMDTMKKVNDREALEKLLAAHRFLKDDPRVRATKRGCIGWCFGGTQSLRLALNAPDLDAAVVFYGQPITDASQLAPMQAKLLAIFGTRDKSIEQKDVDGFEAALKEAGKDYRILRYEAEHAFANPSSGRYQEGAAAEAWKEVLGFFQQNLKPAR
jgi:carboxymethylenebutenolidase